MDLLLNFLSMLRPATVIAGMSGGLLGGFVAWILASSSDSRVEIAAIAFAFSFAIALTVFARKQKD